MAETAESWQPWRALRERGHLVFRLAPLPQGVEAIYWPRGARAAVIVDAALPRRVRKAALAHELVHDERGGGCDLMGAPPGWSAVVAREELIVEAEVARRLVPAAPLARFCARMVELGYGVTAEEVAEEFDVPDVVAARALALWRPET